MQRLARRRRRVRRRVALAAVLVTVAVVIGAAVLGGKSSSSRRLNAPSAGRASGRLPQPPAVPRARPARPLRALRITRAQPGVAHVLMHGPRRYEVALTFDDGLCASCVTGIVRVLERTGAHATIFPNGIYASSWSPHARAIRRLVASGQMAIGNHTFSHRDAVAESPAAFETDLARDETWIERTFHVSARPYFRPPYGAYSKATLDVAGHLGYTRVVLWSGTVADSAPRSVPYILHAIRVWAGPGVIFLMHANYPATGRALPAILRILRARHLRAVTLPELMRGVSEKTLASGALARGRGPLA